MRGKTSIDYEFGLSSTFLCLFVLPFKPLSDMHWSFLWFTTFFKLYAAYQLFSYHRSCLLFGRCQPWTITLTGVLAIAGSWLILHSVIVTTLVFSLISAWWYIFLYSYPKVWQYPGSYSCNHFYSNTKLKANS